MPSTTEICTHECTYKWMRYPWSQCSDKCGGRTFRKVLCLSSEGQQVADSFCIDKKPKTSRRCGRNCAPFWQIGEWSICSQNEICEFINILLYNL
ncbi:unnamed protein product [Oikopleura dioica]|uniref:Uncharacterized protein n=1 Tax=Oikopleura dioica TaxID=34765 RepID=E4YGN4_OIKDI|nr:unnamed protein product [Oikopleura dioica]